MRAAACAVDGESCTFSAERGVHDESRVSGMKYSRVNNIYSHTHWHDMRCTCTASCVDCIIIIIIISCAMASFLCAIACDDYRCAALTWSWSVLVLSLWATLVLCGPHCRTRTTTTTGAWRCGASFVVLQSRFLAGWYMEVVASLLCL